MSIFYTPLSNQRPRRERRGPKGSNQTYVAAISFVAVLFLVIVVALLLRGTKVPPEEAPSIPSAEAAPQVFNLVGQISKVESGSVVIKDSGVSGGSARRVMVLPATVISRLSFVPVVTNGQRRFSPEETPIDFSALKAGWTVEILAAADISAGGEFNAVQIRVLP